MNPAELAQSFANKFIKGVPEEESDPLNFVIDPYRDLNWYAQLLRMLPRTYVVESGKSLVLPVDGDPLNQEGLVFKGDFVSYDEVIPPRYLGRAALGGFCLTFNNVVILPFDEPLVDARLHIPFNEVERIDQSAA